MKIHRFIDNFDLSGAEIEITGEIAHQMAKVLKLEINEQVDLCDGKGNNASGKISSLNKNSVIIDIEKTWNNDNENKKQVSLFCAVLKKENFELVVQKATECGVHTIIPIVTTRTVKTGLNMERLQKIAKEACEQSGRSFVPEIYEAMNFEESLENAKTNDINIIFDASGKSFYEIYCASRRAEHSNSSTGEYAHISEEDFLRTNIFIGPEGGWTPEEIKKATENNFSVASLGTNILRGETAAIIASYLARSL